MFNAASARVATLFTLLLLNVEELRNEDREEGQALVEYGLIIGLIAVVCVLVITTLGGEIRGALQGISNALP